jgi:hypothetical protein
MKEALFILLVVAVLLCWSAIRYRRQIVSFIEFYKQLKLIRSRLGEPQLQPRDLSGDRGIQLIKCSRCEKWIPQSEAMGDVSRPICARGCEKVSSG